MLFTSPLSFVCVLFSVYVAVRGTPCEHPQRCWKRQNFANLERPTINNCPQLANCSCSDTRVTCENVTSLPDFQLLPPLGGMHYIALTLLNGVLGDLYLNTSNFWRYFPMLSSLQIINCSLTKVEGLCDSSSNSMYLSQVELQYNHLTAVPSQFSGCRHLHTICLGHNQITPSGLGNNSFLSLLSLQCLDLSFNRLSSIRREGLSVSSGSLAGINLENNHMATIDSTSGLENACNLLKGQTGVLLLTGNQFVCSCSLSWICTYRDCFDFFYGDCYGSEGRSINVYCESDSCPAWMKSKGIIIIPSAGAVVVILVAVFTVLGCKKRRRSRQIVNETDPLIRPPSSPDIFHEAPPGSVVIDFAALKKLESLGEGGFGVVFKAKWNADNVAVKELRLPPEYLQESEKQQFKNEAELLARLRHPHIVLFMAVSLNNRKMCIVTEYMARGSVADILRPKPKQDRSFLFDRTPAMLSDSAKGMAYLHNRSPPIIHRDLKSANLLVDKNWVVKVADFGVSKLLSRCKDDGTHSKIPGTLLWTAPELMQSNPVLTTKVDVYSYGIVVWEFCAAPQVPFDNIEYSLFKLVDEVKKGSRPIIPSTCPKYLKHLMTVCWDQDYEKRPEFLDVIELIRKELDESDMHRSSESSTNGN